MDYKEMNAIGIVRLMLTDGVISQEVAGKYFPELAESEDEKIRKVLIDWVSMLSPSHFTGELSKEKVLAYLEKQGEQKPVEWKEDETYLEHTINEIKVCNKDYDSKENPFRQTLLNWLKSLKDRCVPQPKQKWSEKDEESV